MTASVLPAPVFTTTPDGVHVYDWTHLPAVALPFAKAGRGWAHGVVRDPAHVDAVLVHQWGVPVGTTPENRARHGEPLALAMRATEAPYHGSCGVTPSGVPVVALVHPVTRWTMHAGPANGRTLGLGVYGFFPLSESGRDVRAHGPAPSAALGLAHDFLLAHFAEQIARVHGSALYLTHRQCVSDSSPNARRSRDPGEWAVARACDLAACGGVPLTFQPDLTLGDYGERWPAEWRAHLPAPPTVQAKSPQAPDASPDVPPSAVQTCPSEQTALGTGLDVDGEAGGG